MLISGSEDIGPLVFPVSHTYVLYPVAQKNMLSELFCLEEVAFRHIPFSLHIGTRCMEDAAVETLTIYATTSISSLCATNCKAR